MSQSPRTTEGNDGFVPETDTNSDKDNQSTAYTYIEPDREPGREAGGEGGSGERDRDGLTRGLGPHHPLVHAHTHPLTTLAGPQASIPIPIQGHGHGYGHGPGIGRAVSGSLSRVQPLLGLSPTTEQRHIPTSTSPLRPSLLSSGSPAQMTVEEQAAAFKRSLAGLNTGYVRIRPRPGIGALSSSSNTHSRSHSYEAAKTLPASVMEGGRRRSSVDTDLVGRLVEGTQVVAIPSLHAMATTPRGQSPTTTTTNESNTPGTTTRKVPCKTLLECTDWDRSALGPRKDWDQAHVQMVQIVLSTPTQACVWWGPRRCIIYNDAYAEVLGAKHPAVFGQPLDVVWPEIFDYCSSLADEIVRTGQTLQRIEDFIVMHRNGFPEETYHNWQLTPVFRNPADPTDKRVAGFLNLDLEVTKSIISHRRLITMRDLGRHTTLVQTVAEYPEAVVEGLGSNLPDIPFALYYSHVRLSSSEASISMLSSHRRTSHSSESHTYDPSESSDGARRRCMELTLTLRASIGIPDPDRHPLSPPRLHLAPESWMDVAEGVQNEDEVFHGQDLDEDLPWPIRKACLTRKPVLVVLGPRGADLKGRASSLGMTISPVTAVVIPLLASEAGNLPDGFLIIGLNPMLLYDADYSAWIDIIGNQVSSSLASIMAIESSMKQTERLAELDRQKSAFFQNASHELRTPLTLIAAPVTDLCEDSTLQGDHRQKLRLVNANVQRLSRLVNSLLDVSKIDASKMKPEWQRVQIVKLTGDLCALFKSAFEKAKLQLHIACDHDRDIYAIVDMNMWEKIVVNLLSNALKYTLHGSVHASCTISNGHLIFTVKDTGCGIPSSELNLIFDRFHRVYAPGRSAEGTGIGLSLTKELVIILGGTIKVQSTWDARQSNSSGSTFTVKIPLEPSTGLNYLAEKTPVSEVPPSLAHGKSLGADLYSYFGDEIEGSKSDSSSANSGNLVTARNMGFSAGDTVLIVDDNLQMRRYIESLLTPFCKVLLACDGVEALEKATHRGIDLILSDVTMPRMDGFALLTALKSREGLRQIPVIILSARAGGDAVAEGLSVGADDYIPKPFNSRELIARVAAHIQSGKKRILLENQYLKTSMEFRAMSDNNPIGITRLSMPSFNALYANPTFWAILDCESDKPFIETWRDAIAPNHLAESDLNFSLFCQDGQIRTWDLCLKNGKYIEVTLSSLGSDEYFLASVMDISDRIALAKETENRLVAAEQRRKEIEMAKKAQEMMIDITSHELRNPISAVLQNAEICKKDLRSLLRQIHEANSKNEPFRPSSSLVRELTEDLESLDSILSCSQAQERICNDVLRLAQIELNTLVIRELPFSVSQKAKEVLKIFQNESQAKGIDLSLHLHRSLEMVDGHLLIADSVRLNQILINLISNAIHYLQKRPERRIDLSVSCSSRAISNDQPLEVDLDPHYERSQIGDHVWLIYSVKDSGPGIALEEQGKLFQKFTQTSNAIHSLLGGSGLGLYICRQLSELLHGRIEVKSDFGHGSDFRFSIRATVGQSELPDSLEGSPDLRNLSVSKPTEGLQQGVESHNQSNLAESILIVEDNAVNAKVLQRQLSRAGFESNIAINGLDFLEKVKASHSQESNTTPQNAKVVRPYKAILCDLSMPVMNGIEAIQKLRAMEKDGTLPMKHVVIAVTGNARPGQRDEALEAGMDEVLIKPYKFNDVLAVIERLC